MGRGVAGGTCLGHTVGTPADPRNNLVHSLLNKQSTCEKQDRAVILDRPFGEIDYYCGREGMLGLGSSMPWYLNSMIPPDSHGLPSSSTRED